MNKVGNAPYIKGVRELKCPEFLYVQYLPVAMKGSCEFKIPENLQWLKELVYDAVADKAVPCGDDYYIYVTAKHMYHEAGQFPNRPQWHIDGYGSDDLNFIWSDSSPTEFCVQQMTLSDDHNLSIQQMEFLARDIYVRTYPAGTFMRLDNTVVHRVAPVKKSGFRTFVKISISKNIYNLKGNAHNHLFDYNWDMKERSEERNHPTA